MDPGLWKDPEVFNPERFLSPCGTRIVKPDYFIPFGVGRRMCLGDTLAKAELFLFFSSMLHVFNLRLPEGADRPTLNGQAGVTVSPQSFKVGVRSDPSLRPDPRRRRSTNVPFRSVPSGVRRASRDRGALLRLEPADRRRAARRQRQQPAGLRRVDQQPAPVESTAVHSVHSRLSRQFLRCSDAKPVISSRVSFPHYVILSFRHRVTSPLNRRLVQQPRARSPRARGVPSEPPGPVHPHC